MRKAYPAEEQEGPERQPRRSELRIARISRMESQGGATTKQTNYTKRDEDRPSPRDAHQEAHDRIPSDLGPGRVEMDQVGPVTGPGQRHQRVRHAGHGELPV